VKRTHKQLDVWKEAVALATNVYKLTEKFPKAEIYGLTSQIRRSTVSVSSNIAEGAARFSTREFAQFLNIAGGSLSELATQIEIASNPGYISDMQKQEIDRKIDSITIKLAGLINCVRKRAEK
jgi:four helix bundle protein